MDKLKVKYVYYREQSSYDALYNNNLVDSGTLYFIKDTKRIYRGRELFSDYNKNGDVRWDNILPD